MMKLYPVKIWDDGKCSEEEHAEKRKRRLKRNIIDKETYERINIDENSYKWEI